MFNNQMQYGSLAQGFMTKVYGWMCVGLATTAAVSYYFSPEMNPELYRTIASNWLISIVLFAAQIGILMYTQANFKRLSVGQVAAGFLTFSALFGVSLASVFAVYTTASVFYVFVVAAAMFAAMAIYGAVTSADLSSMGNILFMGLIGLLIANVINMFVQSAGFDLVIASFGVGIFALMTAYDVQNLKRFSQGMLASPEDASKFALLGAIGLYLNMINLFLYLLRLFGERRK